MPVIKLSVDRLLSCRLVTLPVAGEIDRRAALHCQMGNALRLLAIGNTAIVFTPCRFLSVTEQIGAADMVMVANVTYSGLAERLSRHGLKTETEASIKSKLARGTFAATFLLASLAALELEGVRLEDL
jgi:hypothetical protein